MKQVILIMPKKKVVDMTIYVLLEWWDTQYRICAIFSEKAEAQATLDSILDADPQTDSWLKATTYTLPYMNDTIAALLKGD